MNGRRSSVEAEVSGYSHGRVPRRVREQQLLALAEELFAEHGYLRASMDELARRAGVSKPVVYELIGSKEELYRRCVEQLGAELADAVQAAAVPGLPLERQLRAGVAAFFGFVAAHRSVWEALAAERSPYAAHADVVRRRQDELVARIMADAAEQMGLHPDPEQLDATAHFINGAMEALARWWGAHRDVPAEEISDWAVQLVLPGLERYVRRG